MLERQLEYERVRLEAESRKACLESQEKVGDKDFLIVASTVVCAQYFYTVCCQVSSASMFSSIGETSFPASQLTVLLKSWYFSTVKHWKCSEPGTHTHTCTRHMSTHKDKDKRKELP